MGDHRLGGLGRQAEARNAAALEQPIGVALVELCGSLGVERRYNSALSGWGPAIQLSCNSNVGSGWPPLLTRIVKHREAFMKRAVFIILWSVGFAGLTLVVGMLSFGLLGIAGMASWRESRILVIGRSWSVILFGMPVLGLILGLLGKLQGTTRPERETHT
jgi:hypothetical protein